MASAKEFGMLVIIFNWQQKVDENNQFTRGQNTSFKNSIFQTGFEVYNYLGHFPVFLPN